MEQLKQGKNIGGSVLTNGTLYVVLHGLICLVDVANDGFVAYLNEIGEEHRYSCGDFLAEEEIGTQDDYPSSFELVNVNEGDESLVTYKDQNAIVKMKELPSPSISDVRAIIMLPRPSKIHHFISGKVHSDAFQGDTASLLHVPTYISGIRVFEYSFDDFQKVQVVDGSRTLWQCPVPTECEGTNYGVLHIYNEPPDTMSPMQAADHNLREFNQTLKYLQANLSLIIPGTVPPTPNDPHPLPGLIGPEVSALDTRQSFVNGIMGNLRQATSSIPKSGSSGTTPIVFPSLDQFRNLLLAAGKKGDDKGGSSSQVCGGANGFVG